MNVTAGVFAILNSDNFFDDPFETFIVDRIKSHIFYCEKNNLCRIENLLVILEDIKNIENKYNRHVKYANTAIDLFNKMVYKKYSS